MTAGEKIFCCIGNFVSYTTKRSAGCARCAEDFIYGGQVYDKRVTKEVDKEEVGDFDRKLFH